jgi:hypothetical protein
LLRGNWVEIFAIAESTSHAVRSVDVTVLVADLDVRSRDVSAELDVGVLSRVEQVEFVPTNEVPITSVLIEHKFGTAATAYFPKQARYAHVVSGVVHAREASKSLVGEAGAFVKRVEVVSDIAIGESTEFGFSFNVSQVNAGLPVKRSASVSSVSSSSIAVLDREVVEFSYAITCRRDHVHGVATSPSFANVVNDGVDDFREAAIANGKRFSDRVVSASVEFAYVRFVKRSKSERFTVGEEEAIESVFSDAEDAGRRASPVEQRVHEYALFVGFHENNFFVVEEGSANRVVKSLIVACDRVAS